MTALPDWMVRSGNGLTADDYEALPEEICRQIEIVDGAVVVSPRPVRAHQRIGRRLAGTIEAAVPLAVDTDIDLRLRDVPLLIRCPDIAAYDASLPQDAVLRPEHCTLVVEVMSPSTITTDQVDKPAEYAAAGIEHFWRVELVDKSITLFRYRLSVPGQPYVLVGKDNGTVTVTEPMTVTVDLDALLS